MPRAISRSTSTVDASALCVVPVTGLANSAFDFSATPPPNLAFSFFSNPVGRGSNGCVSRACFANVVPVVVGVGVRR